MPRLHMEESDRLIRTWDRYVTNEVTGDMDIDREALVAIARIHALDDTPVPNPGFLAELERRLTHQAVSGAGGPRLAQAPLAQALRPAPLSDSERGPSQSWKPLAGSLLAVAALLAVMLGGAVIASLDERRDPLDRFFAPIAFNDGGGDQAVVEAPKLEREPVTTHTLFHAVIDPASVTDATEPWTKLESSLVKVNTGEGFRFEEPYFVCCPGLRIYQVLEGTARIDLDGQVRLYRQIDAPTRHEVSTATGQVTLEAGDVAVLPRNAIAVVENGGLNPLWMLSAELYAPSPETPFLRNPLNYLEFAFTHDSAIDASFMGSLEWTIERIDLDPGGSLLLEATPVAPVNLMVTEGMLLGYEESAAIGDATPTIANQFRLSGGTGLGMGSFPPGSYRFVNTQKEPATVYLLRLETPPSESGQ